MCLRQTVETYANLLSFAQFVYVSISISALCPKYEKFSRVSPLLNLPREMAIELAFENCYKLRQQEVHE